MNSTLKQAYRLDDQVGYLLRLATQRHTAIFQTHMPEGLTAPQFATLVRLYEHGPCSQTTLGQLTSIDTATMNGVVDRLRQKQLLASRPSGEDKRRHVVSLTCKGQELMKTLLRAGGNITEETLAPLTKREQTTLLKLLEKLT